ncbi:AraC family transcriptional regulator [Diaminobutyricibacter tongyongensis]|uniref:AraC family transcriptional regulator n=1 Tax=Leifsonia tongyongensis TaxID=1268043 RepID=A0A6L9Y2D2_9MICO|nr:AraC family transcriptional regulator [Diaminobutyricibacter tongyongensis]NEN07830.1 AraC family transcriptional regulator [Diaminobutyricibacter tongyongensis]
MDEISQLLRMARLEATLDTRCLLGGSTSLEPLSRALREIPFHVLLEGECVLEVGGSRYPMTAGDVVIITTGAPHRILTAGVGPIRSTIKRHGNTFSVTTSDDDSEPVIDLFCGHYTIGAGAGAILFGSLPAPTHVSLFGSAGGHATLTRLSELLRSEAELDGAGTAAIMSALCTVLIALVLRTSGTSGAHSRLWTAVSDPRLSRIIQEILARPGDRWSIEPLSADVAMSRATFIRRFQAATGLTFGQFLTRSRLMAAADLLTNSDQNIAAIAAQIGYKSESAFTRAFRAATGEPPSRFRKTQQDGVSTATDPTTAEELL